jgi:hypothetical protein
MAHSLTYSIFPVENGFGYEISDDGNRIIYQPHDPDTSNHDVMSEERAREAAQTVIARMAGDGE